MEAEVGNQRHSPNNPNSGIRLQNSLATNSSQTSGSNSAFLFSTSTPKPTSGVFTSGSFEIRPKLLGLDYLEYLDTRSHLRTYSTLYNPTRPHYFPEVRTCHFNYVRRMASPQIISKARNPRFLESSFWYRRKAKMRLILDLRELNTYLVPIHFKMKSIKNLKTVLQLLHGPSGLKGRLPINSGLPIFSEVPGIHLEGESVHVSGDAFRFVNCPQNIYKSNACTNDSLAGAGSTHIPRRYSNRHYSAIAPRCYNLPLREVGVYVNREKSCLIPTQSLTLLGFVITTIPTHVSNKFDIGESGRVKNLASEILKKFFPIRTLATFLGLLESTRQVIPSAPLRMRLLQMECKQALRIHARKYNSLMSLSPRARRIVTSGRI